MTFFLLYCNLPAYNVREATRITLQAVIWRYEATASLYGRPQCLQVTTL